MSWVVTAWSYETRSPEILFKGGKMEDALSELHLAQQFEGRLYKNVRLERNEDFLARTQKEIQEALDAANLPPL